MLKILLAIETLVLSILVLRKQWYSKLVLVDGFPNYRIQIKQC